VQPSTARLPRLTVRTVVHHHPTTGCSCKMWAHRRSDIGRRSLWLHLPAEQTHVISPRMTMARCGR
jgi:hypothetical protein